MNYHSSHLILVLLWIAGVVIAKGFISTLISIFIPFWAWYLIVEKVMSLAGVI
jgi:type III secretory pathway component EscS